MPASKWDRLLAPWVFVLTGIVFNILSAVITHYFIGLNNDRIGELDREMQNRQILIDSLWRSRIEVERKEEFFLLFLRDSASESPVGSEYYRDYLQELATTHDLDQFKQRVETSASGDPRLLLELSEAALKTIIETINSTYFETLELQEARMPLERANSRLFSIAIFLQVTGLILVLARDLRRH